MSKIESLQVLTISGSRSYVEQINELCAAGVKWIQLRCKELSHKDFVNQAMIAKGICKDHGVKLIVNDSIDACAGAKADGVHIGKEDLDPQIVRNILGKNKIIGYTINSLEQLKESKRELALVDYIGVGPFSETQTKENPAPVLTGEEITEIIKVASPIPVIVIGGIVLDDLDSISKLGAHGVAVAGAIGRADDLDAEAKTFIEKSKALFASEES
jgi:thiamine-phosphate pyrophosphorylase